MADMNCEVLVIGAGPTGLMAANLLRRSGIDVRVVEARSEPSAESRAGIMSCRSLELFNSLGLSDRLLENGTITTSIDFFVSGKLAGALQYDRAHANDTPFQFSLMIPQSRTERVLISALDDLNFTVDRDVTITDIEQDASEVRLKGKRKDGTPVSMRAAWVVGADGSRSIVRQAQKVSFEGAEYAQNFLIGDVKVDWTLDHSTFRCFLHADRLGLFLPLEGDRMQRVMTTDINTSKGESGPETAPLALETSQESFREASQMEATLRDPVWLTRFRTHHRMVDRYRVGRTFLAGDAAHIHSPAGGQGMNTGLQDAANLAWKLARVIRAGADQALLDTYESERLPVARDVIRFTDLLFSAAAGQTGWRAALRDALAPLAIGSATHLDILQGKAFRKGAQIDIEYPRSRYVGGTDKPGVESPTAYPGFRAPNARISQHRDVFDLIAGYRFTLLALSRKPLLKEHVDELAELLADLPDDVDAHIVARLTFGRHPKVEPAEVVEVFDRYELPGPDDQAVLLVRPDGYVTWRGEGLDVAGARAFLSDRFAFTT